ncbi:MAG: alanyl-tRNA editing protein [Alphaproteobacteria bacterium]
MSNTTPPPTLRLYEDDSYLRSCNAIVIDSAPGRVRLNQTILYAEGGGQPGDHGTITTSNGNTISVTNSKKAEGNPSAIWHSLANESLVVNAGENVKVEVEWQRRHRLMRMHTAMHLLCACVNGAVTGGQVGDQRGRIDFNIPPDAINKESLHQHINELIEKNIKVSPRWVNDSELDANPELVRTMSVSPPRGSGRIRLLEIKGVDLQPCGGTHVLHTGEIKPLIIGKIENKGRHNRRINIRFA